MAPASPGCGLQGPPSLGPERPTLRSTAALLSAPLRRRPPSLGGCTASAPGTWHPAVPCLLAARHLHVTVAITRSTDQAHRVVGFEPGSGSPFPHCPLPPEPPGHWAGAPSPALAQPGLGSHMHPGKPRAAGRSRLVGLPAALSPRGGSCRQPAARPPGGRRQAGVTQPHRGLSTPSSPSHSVDPRVLPPGAGPGWQGAQSEKSRCLGSGPRRAPALLPLQRPQSACLDKGPRRRGACLGPLTRPRLMGKASGAGAVGRAAQHSLSFVLTDAGAHGVRGTPSLHQGPRPACDGHSQPAAFDTALQGPPRRLRPVGLPRRRPSSGLQSPP